MLDRLMKEMVCGGIMLYLDFAPVPYFGGERGEQGPSPNATGGSGISKYKGMGVAASLTLQCPLPYGF